MTHPPSALPPHLEDQTSTWLSKGTSARVLGNPVVWSAVTALLILAGYFWLQYYAKPFSKKLDQSHSQNELIGSAQRGGWNPEIYRTVKTEALMNITRQADEIRAENYRTEIDHQNKIQPLLDQARNYLEQDILIGRDDNNAWQLYQRILEIEPGHRIALSGKAQIISILQENAEFAIDEAQFAEAELWLNQLDSIQADDPFQAELRLLIADLINEQLLLEQAAQRNTERKSLLKAALEDATAAMQAEPRGLRMAYDLYQRVLELDEANSDAITGLQEIHSIRAEIASAAIAEGDYASAMTQIERLQQTSASAQISNDLLAALQAAQEKEKEISPEKVIPVESKPRAGNDEQNTMPQAAEAKPATAIAEPENSSSAAIEPTAILPPETTIVVTGRARPKVDEIQVRAPSALSQVESVPGVMSSNDTKTMLSKGIQAYYAGNYKSAFSILHPLAEDDISRAQFRIAMMYYNGRIVIQNKDLARQWIARALPAILQAAQGGHAWAQADLGTAYELGVGVVRDHSRAATWYLKSANQGYAAAQANLGVLYANGNGVKYDRKLALHWLKQAAAQGNKVAMDNLKALNAR